jgi:hypothetical protein
LSKVSFILNLCVIGLELGIIDVIFPFPLKPTDGISTGTSFPICASFRFD